MPFSTGQVRLAYRRAETKLISTYQTQGLVSTDVIPNVLKDDARPCVQAESSRHAASRDPTPTQQIPPINIHMVYPSMPAAPPHPTNVERISSKPSHNKIPISNPIAPSMTPYPLIADFLHELERTYTGEDARNFASYKNRFADREFCRLDELAVKDIMEVGIDFYLKEIGMKRGSANLFLQQLKVRLRDIKGGQRASSVSTC